MRVAVVTPNDADGALAVGFLDSQGIGSIRCVSLSEAASAVDGGGLGCVVLVEEALVEPHVRAFLEAVRSQPPWSDLPLLLVAAQESSLAVLVEDVFPQSGNVTLLQRPLHPVSLVSAVNMALRARQRQYQVRDLLEERSRAVKQRDEFLAMLAHELRNPLAPIRNCAYLLGSIPCDDPLFVRSRAMIEKQTRHITRLVDDLLDVSRLELGKVELRLQPVDLNQAASAAAEACMPATLAHRHNVTVRLADAPLPILADPVRIEQVLGNLVLNAVKFTPEGGSITVEVAREGDAGLVRVVDTGKGIRPEMLATVFELFVQDDHSLARTEGGLGIGLTLVKRLVELHGGSVRVTSAGPGHGACFETRFPLASAAQGAPAASSAGAPGHRTKRVLVVEDGADTRESLGMLLSLWRHEVEFAANGHEALEAAQRMRPDVAIIDIGLPGLDGYTVARHIRQGPLPWARRVKLLALTGYGQASDRERALAAGFDAHILKPVEPVVLEKLLLD